MVPEGERGSLYRQEPSPFEPIPSQPSPPPPPPPPSYPAARPATPEVPASPAMPATPYQMPTPTHAFRTEPPTEVVHGGKKYYTPITANEVADRMIELYGPEGLRKIMEVIESERQTPYWRHAYHQFALLRGEEMSEPPRIELEHMSVDSGPSEPELMSEFFNLPLDYLLSFFQTGDPSADDEEEGWERLNEEVLFPLYYEAVPQAWRMLLPGLPGDIVIDRSEDDGCPCLIYQEIPPEDFQTTEEVVEDLELQTQEYYNRPILRRSAEEESEESGGPEEPEEIEEEEEGFEEPEEAPPPPPKPKKKKRKKK
jgi:hypothetical protein